jgi:hypothetical protein
MNLEDTINLPAPAAAMDGAIVLGHPDDVVRDPSLPLEDKRALLASWASDQRAVPGRPTLRQIDNGALVGLDTIMRALRALDGRSGMTPSGGPRIRPAGFDQRHNAILRRWRERSVSPRSEDDDDPPPRPARAARASLLQGVAR